MPYTYNSHNSRRRRAPFVDGLTVHASHFSLDLVSKSSLLQTAKKREP